MFLRVVSGETQCRDAAQPCEESIAASLSPIVPSLSEVLQPFTSVILTGGSSGIGKSFIQLGQKLKPDLVFCNLSRRPPPENIFPNAEKSLNHFPCDLSRADEVERVSLALLEFFERGAPKGPILLINNSGFGAFGRFADLPLNRELEMIDLNVRAIVHLTGRLLPLLRARGGAIVNIASVVAYQPTPYAATYGATKAFVLHWTLALNEELRGTGVRALAVCPGTTTTEFFETAGASRGGVAASFAMTTEDVVRSAYRALGAGRAQVVPGWKNKLSTFAGSKSPKPMAARIAGKVLSRFRAAKSGR
jgi:uncharacterized protein